MRYSKWLALWGMAVISALAIAQNKDADQSTKTLADTDSSILFPVIRNFVLSPGTKSDPKWVQLEKRKDQGIQFKKVPDGWFALKEGQSEGRIIVLDQNGFRVLITLEAVADVEKAMLAHVQHGHGYRSIVLIDQLFTPPGNQVSRVVKCGTLRGLTHLNEHRYYEMEKGAVSVELSVLDFPDGKRTVDQLFGHLRLHYGKYEGVCQQVESTLHRKG